MPFDPEAIRRFEHSTAGNSAAPVYCSTFAGATAPFIDPLLDTATSASGVRMLDVACGPGFVAFAGSCVAQSRRGFDFSPAMLAVARARDNAIRFDEGDAGGAALPGSGFDAAVANFGIHHVPRPLLALREAHRVLRTGGHVAFSFWAEPSENIAWRLVFDAVARCGDRRHAGYPAGRWLRHRAAMR